MSDVTSVASVRSTPALQQAAVVRLAWVFDDAQVLMLLRLPMLAEATRRRHKVLVLAPGLSVAARQRLAADGIESIALSSPGEGFHFLAALARRRRLARALGDWHASTVVIEDASGLPGAVKAARNAGASHIFPILPSLEGGSAPASAKGSWRQALGMATAVFVPTPNDLRLVREPLGKLGIALALFPQTCLDLDHVPAVAIPTISEGVVILGVEDDDFGDGSAQFAKAVELAAERGVRAHRRSIGMEGTSDAKGRGGRHIAWGDDVGLSVRREVINAHVVVIDGVSALHMALLAAALAVGRPIVAVDHPAHRDLIDVGSNGLLVPSGDTAAMAEALVSLLKRPDLLDGMARASRQKAERRLDQKTLLPRFFKWAGLDDLRVDNQQATMRSRSDALIGF